MRRLDFYPNTTTVTVTGLKSFLSLRYVSVFYFLSYKILEVCLYSVFTQTLGALFSFSCSDVLSLVVIFSLQFGDTANLWATGCFVLEGEGGEGGRTSDLFPHNPVGRQFPVTD